MRSLSPSRTFVWFLTSAPSALCSTVISSRMSDTRSSTTLSIILLFLEMQRCLCLGEELHCLHSSMPTNERVDRSLCHLVCLLEIFCQCRLCLCMRNFLPVHP